MRKYIILVFLFLTVFSFSQVTPSKTLKVANATSAFATNIAVGDEVTDINTGLKYLCTTATTGASTLTTASANFKLLNTGGTVTSVATTSPIVSSGSTTPTISADTTKLVMFNDTLSGQKIATKYELAGKQTTLTNPVTGTGTSGYAAIFTGASTVGNGIINTSGTDVALFSTFKGANSDGYNLFIGGGGQNSVGEVGATYKGSYNTANGMYALHSNTTGFYNTANGYQALFYNTTGSQNTANGYRALFSNTTGSYNTANGMYALLYNTTGYQNTANGFQALFYNTTGSQNTANGFQALFYNTTGYQNTANGTYALHYNTTGSYNTANGFQALHSNTTGSRNTANGYAALYLNTTGSYNTANGFQALFSNTTGYQNTANGMYALFYNTTGFYNTANGTAALYSNTTGINNLSSGYYSGIGAENTAEKSVTDSYMTFLGAYASKQNAAELTNGTAVGYNAKVLQSNQVVIGNSSVTSVKTYGTITAPTVALSNLTDGYIPYHISDASGLGNSIIQVSGTDVTLFSTFKGANSDGYNLFIGGGGQSSVGEVGASYKGSYNTANGYQALFYNTTGYQNTANGSYALFYNTTGNNNTANGMYALFSNTTGYYNTANGYAALYYNTTGINNLSSGFYSGIGAENAAEKSVTDSYMTFLGAYASKQNEAELTNGTAIGYNAKVLQSNQVVLGNDNVTTTLLKGSVGIGTTSITSGYLLDVNGAIYGRKTLALGNEAYILPSTAGTAGQCLVMKTPVGDKVMEWFTAYNASDSTKFPWMYSGGKAIQRATKPVIISDSLRVNRTIESRDSISTWKGVKVYHSNIYLAYGASITFFPWAHGWGTISMFSPAEGEGGTFARFRFDQYGKITLLSDCTSDVILGDVDKYLDLIGQVGTSQIKIKNGMSDSNGHMIIEIVYAIDEAF